MKPSHSTKFKELLAKLQSLEIKQYGVWQDDIPDNIYKEYFEPGYTVLTTQSNPLDLDHHRWYTLSTEVVSVQGALLGIRQVSEIKSETMSMSDVEHSYQFFEMVETTVVSYNYL